MFDHIASSSAGPSKKITPLATTFSPSNHPSHTHSNLPLSAPPNMTTFNHDEEIIDVMPTRVGRKMCVRHKQMANQNINEKLQRSLDNLPTSERSAITHLWSTFSNAPHVKRKLILEGILTMCCFSQLSHLSDSLNQIIRIDPFSLLPREVNLRILGFLDAITLGRAAQVSKTWKALADDDLLWRRMCGQHIDRKCEKCGWGLPLLERRRLKVELNEGSPAAAMGVGGHEHGHDHRPQELVTREEALGASGSVGLISCDPSVHQSISFAGAIAKKRLAEETQCDDLPAKKIKTQLKEDNPIIGSKAVNGNGAEKSLSREKRMTRPWKSVYCERLVVERNWRKGRCKTLSMKGHEDGVMCLQYHTTLSNPSYPVLITGSYDRTVRVWNLDTGEAVHVLRGHTRAVRALQFDQMLLFTGAMDGTVRMWNWRAGECLRVLEGHSDGVVCLNYNGYLLASGSADSTIQVWNFRTGNKFTLRGHDDWVNSVVLWDGKTSPGDIDPTLLPSFPMTSKSTKRATSPLPQSENKNQPDVDAGAMLFSASDDGTIKLWDLEKQECIRTFSGHKAQVQSLKVIMVDMSAEEIASTRRLSGQRSSSPPSTGFQPASTHSPGITQNGHLSPHATFSELVPGFDAAAHLSKPAQEITEPRVHVHDQDDRESGNQVKNGSDIGKREKRGMLVTGALDGTVKLWDVETGVERATLFGHIEGVWSVDIDALRIASASHDRTVKIWDRESGNCIHTFTGHRGAVTSLQLSDDMIVSGSDDGDVIMWNFAPGAAPGTPGVGVVSGPKGLVKA